MFTQIYDFMYQWLFNGNIGALTASGAELVTILVSLVVTGLVIMLACVPIILVWRVLFR